MLGIIEFVCWVVAVALAAAFLLGLAVKWGWIERLQVHAPNEFFYKLFTCKFCCSFHVSMLICIVLCVCTGKLAILLVPVCSTIIARELW